MSEEVNVITAILLAGFAQSLVLSGFLYNKSKQIQQFKILMLIHLVFALDLFLVFAGQLNWLSSRLNACWGAIYAILFFVFIRSCIGLMPSKREIICYFAPWLALNISVIDFLYDPKSAVLSLRHELSGYFLLVIYLYFAIWATVTVRRYRKQQAQFSTTLSNENILLLWGICASLFLAISVIPFQYLLQTSLPLPQLLMCCVMYAITYVLLLKPQLLDFKTKQVANAHKEKLHASEDALLAEHILTSLDEQQLFTDPNLSLQTFAEHLAMKPYLLSQVLNHHLGIKFIDLINQRRIEYVCNLIKNQPHMPMLTIAMQAGFNAKSTFNAAFKKYRNLTPSEYKSQVLSTD